MFVLKVSFKDEIRRISVEENVTFEGLLATLRTIFSKLPEKAVLKYKDEEGDEITVSSDRELSEALRVQKDAKILRFAIANARKPKVPAPVNSGKEEEKSETNNNNNNNNAAPPKQTIGEIIEQLRTQFPFVKVIMDEVAPQPREKRGHRHCPRENQGNFHHARCDGCGLRIPGSSIRFKCNQCPDYDLCDKCRFVVSHEPTHTFAEIKDATLPVHHAICDVCDSTIVGDRYKCAICPNYDFCSECYRLRRDKHPLNHNFSKIDRPFARIRRMCQEVNNVVNNTINGLNNIPLPDLTALASAFVPQPNDNNNNNNNNVVPEVKKEEVPAPSPIPAPVEVPAPVVKEEKKPEVPSKWADKLVQLEQMGFTESGRNVELLEKNNGDLVETIKDLLGSEVGKFF